MATARIPPGQWHSRQPSLFSVPSAYLHIWRTRLKSGTMWHAIQGVPWER